MRPSHLDFKDKTSVVFETSSLAAWLLSIVRR